jgi:hypothetical protein
MMGGILDRSRFVAKPGWTRWLVRPAALSIHLAIGSAYAWRVFKIPLESALGISGTASALPFTIGIVILGLSAALFGTRVDRKEPRWAMFVATVCFCSGLLIAAFGVSISQSPRPRRGPPQTGGEATMTNSESTAAPPTERGPDRPVSPGLIALAWLWVVLPFTYAVWQLFAKITQLFSA